MARPERIFPMSLSPEAQQNLNVAKDVLKRIHIRGGGSGLTPTPAVLAQGTPQLSETSRTAYRRRLNVITELMGFDDPREVLRYPGLVSKRLFEVYPNTNTFASYVTAVMAYYKKNPELRIEYQQAYQMWGKIHAKLKENQKKFYAKNQPTARQARNYVSFREMEEMIEDLEDSGEYATDIRVHMQWLYLHVTMALKPKRGDLGRVLFVTEATQDMNDQGINYLVLHPNRPGARLVLNTFRKTQKTYKQITETVPGRLKAILLRSLEMFPRKYLFVSPRTRQPFNNANTYTQFVRRTVFQDLFGKSGGVTMVRHAFVNDRVDFNSLSLEEREKIARQMGHSVGMQAIYKWTPAGTQGVSRG